MNRYALLADAVFTGEEWTRQQAVLVEDGTIAALLPESELPADVDLRRLKGHLAPAFMDIQLYGAEGLLLAEHPTVEALQALERHCRAGGTPFCLPTLATNSIDVFHRAIDGVRQYWAGGGTGILGLHLEGPWIHPDKRGAHMLEFIHPPTEREVRDLLEYGRGVIRMITLAPEVCDPALVRLIREEGILVSAGHSAATYAQAMRAFDEGIPAITHLYNAMSPLQHRAPGLVGAAFRHPSACASIIVDGHHVDFEAVAIAKQVMGRRLFVITDAVTDTDSGPYRHQRAGDKYECNGILSGSAISMHGSFMNLVEKVGVEVEEALRMCAQYPAEVLGMGGTHGKIAPGYTAQFVTIGKRSELLEVL